ncbi:hypothetical protein F2Q69_00062998 [Brassica cretica]|uniref:Uncharacterized protein n=1 Tax=Brassica cretica TaxID=69181 RepID=A0A8S9RJL4_BRACR|nr:hypothetical protein F2Q69_00062998 [Brassica cretica]
MTETSGLNVFANVLKLARLTMVIVLNVVKFNAVAQTLLMVQEDPFLPLVPLGINVSTPFVYKHSNAMYY